MRRLLQDRAVRITVIYLVLATAWFLVSDQILGMLTQDPERLVWLETCNAWLFVAVTAVLLYFERRQADRNSRQLAAVVASTEDGIVGATSSGIITAWNHGAQRLYGYSAREAIGRSISILLPSEQPGVLYDTLEELRTGNPVQKDESIGDSAEGRKWLSVRMYPIRDAQGHLTGISSTVRDVTRRREYSEALRQQAQIMDQIHDAVVMTDLEGCVTNWNRGAERLYGYTREEVAGRHIAFLYDPQDHNFLRDEVIAPLLREGDHETEVRMIRKSGERLDAHLSLSLLRDDHGEPTQMIGYAVDITKRKRAESAMRMAEVGELASGLVHEVRNPLNAMRMQIAIMHDGLSQPDAEGIALATSQLKCLENEVFRVQELANDFLAYGRPSPDNPESIHLAETVRNIADFIQPEFEQMGAVVDVSTTDGDDLVVNMDAGKLRQILLNLAVNARQAMAEGGKLTLEVSKASESEARISVRDTGCGIPPEKLARIFEVFYSTKDEGTGLGLAIVKQTIEVAGGRIEVNSEPNVGTCFCLYLPLAKAACSTAGPTDIATDEV